LEVGSCQRSYRIQDRERAIGACYDPRELMRSLLALTVATILAGCASARHYVQIMEGRAIGPGELRMRIRTTCGMPQAETIIRGRVGG
jgi:hypothetical protein